MFTCKSILNSLIFIVILSANADDFIIAGKCPSFVSVQQGIREVSLTLIAKSYERLRLNTTSGLQVWFGVADPSSWSILCSNIQVPGFTFMCMATGRNFTFNHVRSHYSGVDIRESFKFNLLRIRYKVPLDGFGYFSIQWPRFFVEDAEFQNGESGGFDKVVLQSYLLASWLENLKITRCSVN